MKLIKEQNDVIDMEDDNTSQVAEFITNWNHLTWYAVEYEGSVSTSQGFCQWPVKYVK